jgi:hypothetical protein
MVQETKCTSGTLDDLISHLWKCDHVVALDAMGALGILSIA